ncbi:hypothetical protein [Rhodospirillum sp. A1_3_36]|uniref:hypothetical protein n=1 Tax=Rhodospirillum sp. A1_3_36 TaxID=3391666 RepID=UPI0039A69572
MNQNDKTPSDLSLESQDSVDSPKDTRRRAALGRLAKLGYVAPVTIAMMSLKAQAASAI